MNNKIYSLQILRAIAAWLVVYHHYMQIFHNFDYNNFAGEFFTTRGGFGVDLFFILSGFVMYSASQRPLVTSYSFFVSRVIRVLPAYWFYSTLLLVLVFFIPSSFSYTSYTLPSLIASYLLVPSENPSGLGVFPFLTVGWTLIFEFVFYSILALSIAVTKNKSFYLCSAIIIMLIFTFPDGMVYGEVLTDYKLIQFVVGMLLGWLVSRNFIRRYFRISSKFQIVLSLAISSFFISGIVEFELVQKTVAAAAIVYGLVLLDSGYTTNNRLYHFLVKNGDYSYSIYLSHALVLGVLKYIFDGTLTLVDEVVVLTLLTLIVFFISKYSFLFIENNSIISNLKHSFLKVGIVSSK